MQYRHDAWPLLDVDRPSPRTPERLPMNRPTSSRTCAMALGGKDNFAVDRTFVTESLKAFPELAELARESRRFLYRVVRHLVVEEGVRQFLDLGTGLPLHGSVHEVAWSFGGDAQVVYVDIDPIVVTHGRALLADDTRTTVVRADVTRPEEMLGDPEIRGGLDFSQPMAVLMISLPHCLPDCSQARACVNTVMNATVPGSFLALSHIVADDEASAAASSELVSGLGLPWRTRTRATVAGWLDTLEPLPPGLVDIEDWRPDPDQPPLPEAHPEVQPFLGSDRSQRRLQECGGLFRRP
jgi:hypothetical protein